MQGDPHSTEKTTPINWLQFSMHIHDTQLKNVIEKKNFTI